MNEREKEEENDFPTMHPQKKEKREEKKKSLEKRERMLNKEKGSLQEVEEEEE